eukprot:COSAG02_NODE_4370_length_5442_cov_338.841475_2_plen_155_part_00
MRGPVRRLLDGDDSGGLDMQELKEFTAMLGLTITEEECAEMLREYIQSEALDGDSPELNFDGFCQLVEPILVELQEADRRVEEVVAAEVGTDAEGGRRLPPGDFEESALGCLTLDNPRPAGGDSAGQQKRVRLLRAPAHWLERSADGSGEPAAR